MIAGRAGGIGSRIPESSRGLSEDTLSDAAFGACCLWDATALVASGTQI